MNTKIKEDSDIEVLIKDEIKKPPLYKVIFYNDDFTPFNFVEFLLIEIFNKTSKEAQAIALKIHKEQKATIAIYTKELAQTKKFIVDQTCEENEHPLRCEIEID